MDCFYYIKTWMYTYLGVTLYNRFINKNLYEVEKKNYENMVQIYKNLYISHSL